MAKELVFNSKIYGCFWIEVDPIEERLPTCIHTNLSVCFSIDQRNTYPAKPYVIEINLNLLLMATNH